MGFFGLRLGPLFLEIDPNAVFRYPIRWDPIGVWLDYQMVVGNPINHLFVANCRSDCLVHLVEELITNLIFSQAHLPDNLKMTLLLGVILSARRVV